MKKQTKRAGRGLSLLLVLALALGLLPGAALAADTTPAEEGNLSSVDTGTLDAMRFDTDTAEIDALRNKNAPPAGKDPILLYGVDELLVGSGVSTYVNDLPDANKEEDKAKDFLTGNGLTNKQLDSGLSGTDNMVRSVALDPLKPGSEGKDGRKYFVAQVYATNTTDKNGEATAFALRLLNAETGTVAATAELGSVGFALYPLRAGAFLPIAAGDFDGDGAEEIAVYAPGHTVYYDQNNSATVRPSPKVEIYKYDGNGTLTLTASSTLESLSQMKNGQESTRLQNYLSVSLAAVPVEGNAKDDLAVAVGYARHTGASVPATYVSRLVIWRDPCSKVEYGGEFAARIDLVDYWRNDYNVATADGYQRETMMFPSVCAGDIDGDGQSEVVVAGYRTKSDTSTNCSGSNPSMEVDHNRCLVTWFNYDKDKYTQQGPMQWISLAAKDYGGGSGAIELGSGFRDDNDFKENMLSPLALSVFAERGTGYFNSVFVGGYVLMLPDLDRYPEELSAYTGGYEATPDDKKLNYNANEATFRIRYGAPVRACDTAYSSISNRTVLEATAGNFNNNALGREQVVFTYMTKKQQGTGSYSTFLCGLNMTGDAGTTVGNQAPDSKSWADNVTGVKFSYKNLAKEAGMISATVADPDVDHDSALMRYTDKEPAYYFSDPAIIAVLQAAPYFKVLRDECSNPATGVTNSKGTSSTVENAVEISSSLGVGFEVGISGGTPVAQADVFTFSLVASIQASAGYSRSDEFSRSVSTNFTAGYDDTVALTMTPYVRYFYETWNPEKGVWGDSFMDVPLSPQTSQMAVDDYDEVARENGWPTLRDNALFNAQAGQPATYRSSVPVKDKEWFGCEISSEHSTKFIGAAYSDGGAVGKSCATGYAIENGITYGGGVEVGLELQLFAYKEEASVSVGYSGGFSTGSSTEAEYAASVPDLPSARKGSYGFDWDFGNYMADLDGDGKEDCPVLMYLVRNVRALPEAPEDLNVLETAKDYVSLEWSGSPSDVYYELGRQLVDGSYFPLGTVRANDDGHYIFIDTECEPGETYTYAVRTYGYAGNLLRSSGWSAPLQMATLRDGGASIRTQPEDAAVRAGETATFKVAVAMPAGSGGQVKYTWQSRTAGGEWKEADNTAGTTLRVETNAAMDGRQYRCVVTSLQGILYTKVVTLSVNKWDSGITLELNKKQGYASEAIAQGREETTVEYIPMKARKDGKVYAVMTYKQSYWDHYLLQDDQGFYYGEALDKALKEAIGAIGEKNPVSGDYVMDLGDNTFEQLKRVQTLGRYCSADLLTKENYTELSAPVTVTNVKLNTQSDSNLIYRMTVKEGEPETEYVLYAAALVEGETRYYQRVNEAFYELVKGGDAFTPHEGVTLPDGAAVPSIGILEETPETVAGTVVYVKDSYRADMAYQGTENEKQKTVYAAYDDSGVVWFWDETDTSEGKTPTYYFSPDLTDNGYCYGENLEKTLTDFNPSNSSQVLIPASVSKAKKSWELGEELTLTARVSADGGAAADGQVVFEISGVNGTTTATEPVRSGQAAMKWRAEKPGTYQVTARYTGDKTHSASVVSASQPYSAYHREASWLEFDYPSESYVGTELTLRPYLCRYENGEIKREAISATCYLNGVPNEDFDMSGSSCQLPEAARDFAGRLEYRATAVKDGNTYTVEKLPIFRVQRPLTVTVLPQALALDGTSSGWGAVTQASAKTVALDGTDHPALESFELVVENGGDTPSVGTYTIRPEWSRGVSSAFRGRYNVTFVSGMVRVSTKQYKVDFATAPAAGGQLTANGGGLPVSSGTSVDQGTGVVFTATLNQGYSVEGWDVTVGGVRQDGAQYGAQEEITVRVTGDVSVTARFKANEVSVRFDQPRGGALTARLDGASGETVESGQVLAPGDKVFFSVAPESDFTVEQWLLNGSPVKAAGQVYTGQTYTTDALYEAADVAVVLTDHRVYRVTASAVDETGGATDLGSVAVDTAAVPDGDGAYPSGSAFTFTASAEPGAQILEWRSYRGEDYDVLQGNVGAYTVDALQSDLDLRVVFRGEQTFKVTFGPAEADTGAVTARAGSQSVTSEDTLQLGAAVTFTAVPESGMETARWMLNGVVQDSGGDPDVFKLDSLSADADVRAVFLTAPTVEINQPENGAVSLLTDGQTRPDTKLFYGKEAELLLTPETGFELTALTVNGVNVLDQAAYTDDTGAATDQRGYSFLVNLRQEYTVAATFAAIPSVTVAYSVEGDHGDVSVSYARKGTETDDTTGSFTALRDGVVTLTAAPASGYRVAAWTLNGSTVEGSKSNTLTLPILTADQTVSVSFKEIDNQITFSCAGEGALTAALDEEGEAALESGTVLDGAATVYFFAEPGDGWEIDCWTVDGEVAMDGDTPVTESRFTCEADATTGVDVTVRFTRAVSVAFGGEHGAVTALAVGRSLESGGTVPAGTAVTFRAVPERGYAFTSWGDNETANPRTVAVEDDLDLTAGFEPAETCKIIFGDPAGGTMTATRDGREFTTGGLAKPGDAIEFRVSVADDNFAVTAWTDNGVKTSSGGDTYSLTVTGDHEIGAAVSRSRATLTYGVLDDMDSVKHGTVDAVYGPDNTPVNTGDKLPVGSPVTFTAHPADGFMVEGWYLDGTLVNDSKGRDTYEIGQLNADADVQVKFVIQQTNTVTIVCAGTGAGTVTATVDGVAKALSGNALTGVPYGARVVLTAKAQPYNKFIDWSGDAIGTGATLDLGRITAAKSVTATFNKLVSVNLTVTWTGEGSLSAQAGYDGKLTDLGSVTSGTPIQVIPGQTLELTAAPTAGNAVAAWTVDGAAQPLLNETLTLTVPNRALAVGVAFSAADSVTGAVLTITPPQNGTVEVKAGDLILKTGDKVAEGTQLTLTAKANGGYTFSGWGGDMSGTQTGATYTVKQTDSALTISASFSASGSGSSGGGGGGGGGTATGPVKNPDGSTTTTETDRKTGAVTETTKYPDGTVQVVETRKDGTVTEKIETKDGGRTETVKKPDGSVSQKAETADGVKAQSERTADGRTTAAVTIPEQAVTGRQSVALPILKVEAAAEPEKAAVITVTAPGKQPVKVEIPLADMAPGIVAVLVLPDGTEKIVKTSVLTETGLILEVEGEVTVKVVDNTRDFADVDEGNWAKASIQFAVARGILNGTGDDTFDAAAPMTRAMMMTLLARLDDQDTTAGDTWYEAGVNWAAARGISDGADPEREMTREQLATMLYRYAGGPEADETGLKLGGFEDTDQVSDFAADAMAWALDSGIVTGKDGSRLDPKGSASRAEVAAMIERYCRLQMTTG